MNDPICVKRKYKNIHNNNKKQKHIQLNFFQTGDEVPEFFNYIYK